MFVLASATEVGEVGYLGATFCQSSTFMATSLVVLNASFFSFASNVDTAARWVMYTVSDLLMTTAERTVPRKKRVYWEWTREEGMAMQTIRSGLALLIWLHTSYLRGPFPQHSSMPCKKNFPSDVFLFFILSFLVYISVSSICTAYWICLP